jgi:hypothetical protein
MGAGLAVGGSSGAIKGMGELFAEVPKTYADIG